MAVTSNYGAAPTYVKIASTTLGSASSSYTFSNIPQGYTDLRLVCTAQNTSANFYMEINADTGANYSMTYLDGDGSSALSGRFSGLTVGALVGRSATFPDTTNVFGTCLIDVMNYANTTTYKTVLSRYGNAGVNTAVAVNLWRSTSAITQLKLVAFASNFRTGSTFTLYGIKAAIGAPKAIGGDSITTDGTYWYHAFRNTGAFKPSQAITADVLQIAGGGSGAVDDVQFWGGGGGGAGGVSYVASQSLTANTSYTATVGAGGMFDWTWPSATKGSNSQFGSLTAAVGGGVGIGNYSSGLGNGGSGGGGFSRITSTGGTATAGQGNAGGTSGQPGGGGGGAGGAGGNAPNQYSGGLGGVGTSTYSSWGAATNTGHLVSGVTYFAGGGGGGSVPYYGTVVTPAGGSGGGGAGSVGGIGNKGTSGLSNTGGGGGGGGGVSTAGSGAGPGGNGGSGIIIVRYTV
jgi:hypothetical protein